MDDILTIEDFVKRFSSEEACFEYFVHLRWPNGFRCPVCNHDAYYFLNDKQLFQCKSCGRQTSVTAGTVFHRLQHPYLKLLWAVYLVATTKKGISGSELQRKLGISSYKTAWLLLHKIREAMSPKGIIKLKTEVEVDETFVGGHRKGCRRNERKSHGSGSAPDDILRLTRGLAEIYWRSGCPRIPNPYGWPCLLWKYNGVPPRTS
jgi:transposase-like protein